jgi:cysteine sulfinate desulfinase/cysteine desulfurase-like protein
MNLPVDVARGSVRLSLGRLTTEAEVDRAAEALLRRSRS